MWRGGLKVTESLTTNWRCPKGCGTVLNSQTAQEHQCFPCRRCKRERVLHKKAWCPICKAGVVPFKPGPRSTRKFSLSQTLARDVDAPASIGQEDIFDD